MKKVFGYLGLLVIFLFIIILVTSFVFAQETNFEALEERASGIDFSKLNLSANFSYILLGILLWMVLYSVFSQIGLFENKVWLSSGISLIVTILAFIYIPQDLVKAIGVEYGALGATIITVIPFAIAIYFTVWVSKSLSLARAIWFIFFLYYIVILFHTWGIDENIAFNFLDKKNLFYEVAAIASLILFIFLGPLRRLVWEEHVRGVEEKIKRRTKMFGIGLRTAEDVAKEAGSERTPLGGVN